MFEYINCRKNYFYNGWGKGPPFWRGFGPGGFGPARFERGDLKYVILDLLKDQPRHGYDIIQAMEQKFHGLYSPSPGSVYPILQLLEDQDLVTSSAAGGKKVYTITQRGKTLLAEHADELHALEKRIKEGSTHAPDMHELMGDVREIGQVIFHNAREGKLQEPETMKRLREALRTFKQEVEDIFAE